MTSAGEMVDPLAGVGAVERPRLVGVLVVMGWSRPEAEGLVDTCVRHAVRTGAGTTDVVDAVLRRALDAPGPTRESARSHDPHDPDDPADPDEANEPDHQVAAALRAIPYADGLATIARVVFGPVPSLAGRPDRRDELAGALHLASPWDPTVPDRPTLAEVLDAAVASRAPAPDPDLVARIRRAAHRRRRLLTSLGAIGVVVVLAVAATVAAALARRDEAPGTDGAIVQWVAVLETAPAAFDLYPAVRDLGRVVGVYAFTDRWACYEGFGEDPPDGQPWFLGIAAPDRPALDELVQASGRAPIRVARVRQGCVLPPPDPGGAPITLG